MDDDAAAAQAFADVVIRFARQGQVQAAHAKRAKRLAGAAGDVRLDTAATETGIAVTECSLVQPSLEDVFLEVIEQREKASAV